MRDVLPNGVVVEGTLDHVNTIRRAFGYDVHFTPDGVHYKSSTRGVVRIADMDTNHIKNAARKLFSTALANLDTRASLADFLTNLQGVMRDVTLIGLLQQLQLRQARGEK